MPKGTGTSGKANCGTGEIAATDSRTTCPSSTPHSKDEETQHAY